MSTKRETMTQHTPGPWATATVNAGHPNPSVTALGIVGADNTVVARIPAEYKKTHAIWPLAAANARLIAQAPAMLEIIRALVSSPAMVDNDEPLMQDARAILRAVEG